MKKLFLLGTMLFAFSAAFAQNYYPIHDYGLRSGTTRLDLYGGMVLPASSWSHDGEQVDLGEVGWTAGMGFYRNLTSVVALGVDGNYAQFGDGDKREDGSRYRTGVATGLIAGRVNFFPKHSTRIYIPAGIGIGHTFIRHKFDDDSHKTYNSTSWAAMLGLGLEFDIDEEWIFGVEARYYRIQLKDEVKAQIGKNHTYYTDVMLKFGFKF
ncbi:MAG: outer membrane beta-barrel protein [Elusimicrobiaceae bacterium]|nr:outer membrane beta-barrel protein [Elusimicrobiaceae bacterium]MBP5617262.1 outer membrane beta-barrel protein [Elusimicrobiaceae bacterium]